MKRICLPVFFAVAVLSAGGISSAQSDPAERGFFSAFADSLKEDFASYPYAVVYIPKEEYSLAVDYDAPLRALIGKGNYMLINQDIDSNHFQGSRSGKARLSVKLIHFDRGLITRHALEKLDKLGYRPLDIQELLEFGAKYPELQRMHLIVGLGSQYITWDRNILVPYLWVEGPYRKLGLSYTFAHYWRSSCLFAVVSK